MKHFEQQERKLRFSLKGRAAKHHSGKTIKKLRNKSFRMKLKNDLNASKSDLKRDVGYEY
jgi:hypothetical protein